MGSLIGGDFGDGVPGQGVTGDSAIGSRASENVDVDVDELARSGGGGGGGTSQNWVCPSARDCLRACGWCGGS